MSPDQLGFRRSSDDSRSYPVPPAERFLGASGVERHGDTDSAAIGLELGKRTYFEAPSGVAVGNGGGSGCSAPAVPPTRPLAAPKRARNSSLSAKCQVQGCSADLSSVKDYHRRHKVCPNHSKSPKVIVAGLEQRFCQQCSRFHGLTEFDEGKRSCRRRLAGHNERRRKPQPDALGFHARFLPAFQDNNRRLGHLYSDSPFLHHLKLQCMSPLWDEIDGLNGQRKSTWPPRMFKYGEQSSSSQCALPTAGMGLEQLFLTGLQHQNDSRQLPFLPQSPKGMIPVSNDMTLSKTNRYVQGSVSPMHQSLSLVSSGTGVLSGLEAIPVGQGFTRVSDSGCALSLQSNMQLWSSAQASVADSMDSTPSLMSDHDMRNTNIPVAEPLVQQHQLSWANDKLLSGAFSSHGISSTNTMDKDTIEVPISNGLSNAAGNYECLRIYSMLHSEDVQVGDMADDVKQTIDLMQVACAPHGQSTEANVSSGSFDLGNCQFGDLQPYRAYGSSIFNSQQI